MHDNELGAFLGRHFGETNVTKKRETVWRCVRMYNKNIPYEIVYVDSTNKWIDLQAAKKYIEGILLDDFYGTENYLQWNFYYYFIGAKQFITTHLDEKRSIEADQTYARKLVLPSEEFVELLALKRPSSEAVKSQVSADLYTVWLNKLRNAGLHFVYNEKSYPEYKSWVEEYIGGKEFDDHESLVLESVPAPHKPLNRIKTLSLEKFRRYPSQKSYKLGSVNLIYGSNAVGKSSLLDAIEMVVTGVSSRSTSLQEYDISVTDDNSETMKFPADTKIYKERDISWYGSAMTRGNKLNFNFKKFNYYNSDAAFELKISEDRSDEKISKIIADIALGREVNMLEERMIGFRNRFQDLAESLSEEEANLGDELAEANGHVSELLAQNGDLSVYKSTLIGALGATNWKYADADEPAQLLSNLESTLSKGITIAERLSRNDNRAMTWSALKEKEALLRSRLALVEKQLKEISSNQQSLVELGRQKKEKDELAKLLGKLQPYFAEDVHSGLFGLDNQIQINSAEQSVKREIKELAVGMQPRKLDELSGQSIPEILSTLRARGSELVKRLEEIGRMVNELQQGMQRLNRLVGEIKNLGKEYLTLSTHKDTCPLCNSHFQDDNLTTAIHSTDKSFGPSNLLTDQLRIKTELELENESVIASISYVQKLREISLLLFPSAPDQATPPMVINALQTNDKALTKLTDQLVNLNTLKSNFNRRGLQESEYHSLVNRLKTEFGIAIEPTTDFNALLGNTISQIENIAKSHSEIEQSIGEREAVIAKQYEVGMTNTPSLRKAIDDLSDASSAYEQLSMLIDVPTDFDGFKLQNTLGDVESAVRAFRNQFEDQRERSSKIDLYNASIDKVLENLGKVKPRRIRAAFAAETLNSLMEEHSKAAFLGDYLKSNRLEIVNIFKLIHSPREFVDIDFEGDKLTLKTIEGEIRSLNEISTGQRSALALSLFISLNRKLANGPNVMLLDDPVANVDDLNVLSFFDFVREFVLATKRQIFFATANSDLAFLFRKKFEFLGQGEFSSIELSRGNE
jgi:exonuclease SbcC